MPEPSSVTSGPLRGPLLPEQARFLERDLPEPHHWNVSQLYAVPPELGFDRVRAAVRSVVARNDVLRLRLDGDGYTLLAADERFDATVRDTAGLTPDELTAFVTADAQKLHRQFVLEQGPLLRCVHYPHPSAPRLLLLCHHFVVDQVGWLLLQAQLDAALREAELKPPAVSYHDATRWLADRACSAELAADAEAWERLVGTGLPVEPGPAGGPNSVGLTELTCARLPATDVRSLLGPLAGGARVTINAVAVVAVLNALFPGRDDLRATVNLIGSGRRGIPGMPNLSGTVGDFTCLYPVTVELATNAPVVDQLQAAQRHLDRVPSAGITFGLLKYLGEPRVRERLRRLPIGDITANYVGRRLPSRLTVLREVPESSGDDLPLGGERDNLHEVDFVLDSGALEIRWYTSSGRYPQARVESYLANAVGALSGAGTPDAEHGAGTVRADEREGARHG
ncbi:condensation domain-containing protein [Streptomyces sp. NPDC017941]|uniref:condensation domain-containing protein n=1 Tax=Streptomyces sp. NPDC017941 TaxID=3365018 RepID=UPI0037BC011E